MKRNNIYSLIGLAMRAGKVASGEFSTEKAVKTGKACLVIMAEDASDRTKKECSDMCSYYRIPFAIYGTKEELGHCIGKEMRASLAVLEPGLGRQIAEKMKTDENMEV